MRTAIISLVVLSLVAAVFSTMCPQGDLSQCSMTCSDPTQSLGCDHGVCTCLDAGSTGSTCSGMGDCDPAGCHDHDHGPGHHGGQEAHCLDGVCQCLDVHP